MVYRKKKIPFLQVATVGLLPSFLKKAYYRMKGYSIGKGVRIGPGSIIAGKQVVIGDYTSIGLVTVIRAEQINIGRHVTIGSFSMIDTGRLSIAEDARINEQVIVGGMKTPESALTMGKRTVIMEYSFVNTTKAVSIGDDSGVGGHCLLFTHGSWLNQLEGFPVTFAPISIGKNVWLPWRVFIMPGVTIGDRVVVGANSMLTKSVPGNCLVAGSPAKIIRENYVNEPSPGEKEKMFRTYLGEFAAQMQYHGIRTTLDETPGGNVTVTVSGDGSHKLYVNFGADQTDIKAAVIVFNITGQSASLQHSGGVAAMLLDVGNKQRKGSTPLGEEFVKFVSRYGLRFDRLD